MIVSERPGVERYIVLSLSVPLKSYITFLQDGPIL